MIYINGRFLTQKMTGVQRFALSILIELLDQDVDFTVLVPKNQNLPLIPSNMPVKKIGNLRGNLWEQIDLAIFLYKKNNPLLLNLCNTAPIFYNKNIYTLHDLIFKNYPESYSFLFRSYYNFSTKILLKTAKLVFTVSDFSKSEIKKYYPNIDKNIYVIHNAVSKSLLDNISTDKCNAIIKKDNHKYIMTQAYYHENKNLDTLLDAFNKIDNSCEIYLYLVGPHISFFADKLNILLKNPRIIHIGRVSDTELIKLYQNAFCYVIPSKFEGFGIPPLEAQACSCPVISSNTSSLPEVVGDSALLFDPESSFELYNQIMKLINDSDGEIRNSLIEKGILNYKKFSYKDSAIKICNIINSLPK